MRSHDEMLATLARLATKAGEIVLDVYATDFDVEHKGPNDPVTVADERANAFLVTELAKAYPGVPIVAEESEASKYAGFGAALSAFFVDPLDGTREFVAKNGEFVVMIGYAENGRAVAGVVHAPVRRTTWTGLVAGGAFEEGDGGKRRLAIRPASLDEARVVVSRSRRSERLDAMLASGDPSRVKQMGSAGLKAVSVARGEADLYVQLGRAGSLWDACAPEAIVRGAGGEFTHEDGEPVDYAADTVTISRGIVAAHPALHADVLRRLGVRGA